MAESLYLALVFHNHQPVGQFDRVTEHIVNVSYLPLIELLEHHPSIKVGMHYSGLLLHWFKEHQPQMIERLRALVVRGQIELISGGYYEPILGALPDEDKIGQIEKLNAELRDTFGVIPSGMWLAERVWEPHLARPIAEAGLRYVILDDTHFESVGLDKELDLFGYYITEEQGYPLAVLATLHHLRYAIPWQPVESLIDWLLAERDQSLPSGQPKLAFMGDNGEKFGTWPGTFEHCWGEPKYMESLFDALEDNADWLHTTTPSAYMAEFPPLGRIYLPTASYLEMGKWSLPADAALQLEHLHQELEDAQRGDVIRFLRGGLWRNFLVKYDEINQMHKRMLQVSQKVHAMRKGRKRDQALDLLWAAQSNDPYWHGLFGGIYLFNVRAAIYENLIAAESAVDSGEIPIGLQRIDFDRDGSDDVTYYGPPFSAIWDPAQGGSLVELDFRPANYNLLNVMTRRREGYHADLAAAAAENAVITPQSMHGVDLDITSTRHIRAKESGLEQHLIYDWHRRASFLDHFVAPATRLDEFYRAQYAEQGDFVNQPYKIVELANHEKESTLRLRRDGQVWIGETQHRVTVSKAFKMISGEPSIQVAYTLRHEGSYPIDLRFGIETVVGFDGAQDWNYSALRINEAPKRLSLADLREAEAVFSHAADSNLRNLTLWTRLSKPCFLWQFPLETVSHSEAGFERGYQGTVFLHLWNVRLTPGEAWEVTITQSVQQAATRPG